MEELNKKHLQNQFFSGMRTAKSKHKLNAMNTNNYVNAFLSCFEKNRSSKIFSLI